MSQATDMTRFEKERSPAIETAIVASLALVFAVDLLTPLGVAEWVFYLVPVTLSLFVSRPRTPLLVALACTALIAFGVIASAQPSPGLSPWLPRVNRAMATAAIWAVAVIARRFIIVRLTLREQEWIRSRQRELTERMQGEQTLAELGDNILRCLCESLEVPVGVLYAAAGDGAFQRQAAYALGGEVEPRLGVAPGEGLVGQAIKDRRLLRYDELPKGYLSVSSALGEAKPAHLIVVPVEVDGSVNGAVELGFLHPVGRSDLDLLETMRGPVAVALRSAQYRLRQAELLAQTQQQAEELQVQQEELRVANEELEEQSRALKESQAQLEAQQAELEQTNAHLEEQAQALEQQRDALSHAQTELLEKADALERASQYKSEFLANMSHELRTPLNSALILAKLLADNKDGNLTPEQVKFASTIHSAGVDLLSLINDILDLSRIEAGRVDLQPERVSVAALTGALERTFRPLADDKHLSLEFTIAPGTPALFTTDPLRLQQILKNLLSNALKFTAEGQVQLTVTPVGSDRIAFSVRDTGVGIPVEQHELVFDAFRQADGSTHRRYGGTGLGLTISRELARRLGGSLSLESEVGRGSTFTLLVPLTLDAEAMRAAEQRPKSQPIHPPPAPPPVVPSPQERRPTPPPPSPRLEDDRARVAAGERTILIVEDDPRFAVILRDLAREQRFRALVAMTAAEGVELATEFAPSAILLDVHLPDRSGLSLLEELKRNGATRHIPVHVMSVADYTQQAFELGAVGYALKPVRREQIVSAIERLEQKLDQKVRRILIVEDAQEQRESLEALLRGQGVEIVSAARGKDALELLATSTFDCMVLDLSLPDISGYDLLERMASGEAFSFPPVIVYTGRELSRDEELRLRRFASSVIIKGARSPERLLDEVSLFLHQVEAQLPPEQQRILRLVRERDAAFEGRRILVVEDDARNIFALSSILEPKGAKLVIARNGREALDRLESVAEKPDERVDLVLMDIMMPVMDGITATREIRRRAEWKRLPIIALTAKAMLDDRQRCIEAGASDYIPKPLDVDKLVSLLKVWLPK